MRTSYRTALLAVVAAGTLATVTACPASDPCEVRPTHAGLFGQCVEADGELCDDDPCDSDDDEYHKPKPIKSTKPAVKPTRKR